MSVNKKRTRCKRCSEEKTICERVVTEPPNVRRVRPTAYSSSAGRKEIPFPKPDMASLTQSALHLKTAVDEGNSDVSRLRTQLSAFDGTLDEIAKSVVEITVELKRLGKRVRHVENLV